MWRGDGAKRGLRVDYEDAMNGDDRIYTGTPHKVSNCEVLGEGGRDVIECHREEEQNWPPSHDRMQEETQQDGWFNVGA